MSDEDKELERIIKESLDKELAYDKISVSEELIRKTLAKAENDNKEKKNTAKSRAKRIRMIAGAAAACLIVIAGIQVMKNRTLNMDSTQMESAQSMDSGMNDQLYTMEAAEESKAEENEGIMTDSSSEAAEVQAYKVDADTEDGKRKIEQVLALLAGDQVVPADSNAEGQIEIDVSMKQSDDMTIGVCITSDDKVIVSSYENEELKSEVIYKILDAKQFRNEIREILS